MNRTPNLTLLPKQYSILTHSEVSISVHNSINLQRLPVTAAIQTKLLRQVTADSGRLMALFPINLQNWSLSKWCSYKKHNHQYMQLQNERGYSPCMQMNHHHHHHHVMIFSNIKVQTIFKHLDWQWQTEMTFMTKLRQKCLNWWQW